MTMCFLWFSQCWPQKSNLENIISPITRPSLRSANRGQETFQHFNMIQLQNTRHRRWKWKHFLLVWKHLSAGQEMSDTVSRRSLSGRRSWMRSKRTKAKTWCFLCMNICRSFPPMSVMDKYSKRENTPANHLSSATTGTSSQSDLSKCECFFSPEPMHSNSCFCVRPLPHTITSIIALEQKVGTMKALMNLLQKHPN